MDSPQAMYGVYDGHGPAGHDCSDLSLRHARSVCEKREKLLKVFTGLLKRLNIGVLKSFVLESNSVPI